MLKLQYLILTIFLIFSSGAFSKTKQICIGPGCSVGNFIDSNVWFAQGQQNNNEQEQNNNEQEQNNNEQEQNNNEQEQNNNEQEQNNNEVGAIDLAQVPEVLRITNENLVLEDKKICSYDLRDFLQEDVSKDNLQFEVADNRAEEFFRLDFNSPRQLPNGQVDYRPHFNNGLIMGIDCDVRDVPLVVTNLINSEQKNITFSSLPTFRSEHLRPHRDPSFHFIVPAGQDFSIDFSTLDTLKFLDTMDVSGEVLSIFDSYFNVQNVGGYVQADPENHRVSLDQYLSITVNGLLSGRVNEEDLFVTDGGRLKRYLVEFIYSDRDGYVSGQTQGNGQHRISVIDPANYNFNPPDIPRDLFSYRFQLNDVVNINLNDKLEENGIIDPDGGSIRAFPELGFQFNNKDPRFEWEQSSYPFNPYQANLFQNQDGTIRGTPQKRGTYYFFLRVETSKQNIWSWRDYFKGTIVIE